MTEIIYKEDERELRGEERGIGLILLLALARRPHADFFISMAYQ